MHGAETQATPAGLQGRSEGRIRSHAQGGRNRWALAVEQSFSRINLPKPIQMFFFLGLPQSSPGGMGLILGLEIKTPHAAWYSQKKKKKTTQDNPFFYSKPYGMPPWASLVVQLVKNPPAMRETWVWSLGWEDPPEKGKATHSSILAWRVPWGHVESDTTERLSLPSLEPGDQRKPLATSQGICRNL